MGIHAAVLNDEQRDAAAKAYLDDGIRPAQRVVELAAAGKLTSDPFEINAAYVRQLASTMHRRRRGKVQSDLANLPPQDAVEALRKRLVNLADWMTAQHEKKRKRGTLTEAEIRELARCLREIAAIPGPNDKRPVQPGQKIKGEGRHNDSRTRSGLAATMLADLEGTAQDVRVNAQEERPQRNQSPTNIAVTNAQGHNNAGAHATPPRDDEHDETGNDGADSWLREQVAGLRGATGG